MMDKIRKKTTTIRRIVAGKGPPAWRRWSGDNPVLRVLYASLIIGGIVAVLGPRLRDQDLPRPGVIAQRNWDATIDFTFERPNPDVEEQRDAAEAQVLPIYRYLPEKRDRAVELVGRAFEIVRPVVRDHRKRLADLAAQLETDKLQLEARRQSILADQVEHGRLRIQRDEELKRRRELKRQREEEQKAAPPAPKDTPPPDNGKGGKGSKSGKGGKGGSKAAPTPAPPESPTEVAEGTEPAPAEVTPPVFEPLPPLPERDFAAELAELGRLLDIEALDHDQAVRVENRSFEDAVGALQLRFQDVLRLGPTFDTDDFAGLVRIGFDESVERLIKQVVKGVMEQRIVRTRYQLEDRLRKGVRDPIQQTVFTIDDLDLFIEVDSARAMAVERARGLLAEVAARPPVEGEAALGPREQNAVVEIASTLIDENYVYDSRATQAEIERARAAVVPVKRVDYQKGQKIVARGERVTEEDVAVLTAMLEAHSQTNRLVILAGLLVFTALAAGFLWLFARRDVRKMLRGDRDLALFGLIALIQIGLVELLAQVMDGVLTVWENVPEIAFYLAIPFGMGAMLIRLFLSVEAAVFFSALVSLLTGLAFHERVLPGWETTFPQFVVIYALLTSLAGTYAMHDIRQRTSLLRAGFFVGLVSAVVVVSLALVDGGRFDGSLLSMALAGLIAGVLDYLLVLALTPALEYTFGYTTDIKLLELANITQPALKELSMKAPGTYHHSVMVGNLAEAAAESIGANPLLTRVGAYYHDLGKMRNPRYFAENQAGDNPHDKIKPQMSALIIKSHVKDGIEIARGHRLPQDIADFVPQHHGTALIAYFYARAKEMATQEEVDEADYRYPGPKPQKRETALVMLADGVEAAARSLPEPTPARIKGLVKKIINGKFIDGQLDECDLTLRDLHEIERSFTRILVSMYHVRPEYPKIPGEDERARARGGGVSQIVPASVGAQDGAARKKPRREREDGDARRAEQPAAEEKGGLAPAEAAGGGGPGAPGKA